MLNLSSPIVKAANKHICRADLGQAGKVQTKATVVQIFDNFLPQAALLEVELVEALLNWKE